MKFLLWAGLSLITEVTFDDVYWIGAPLLAALVVVLGLDIADSRKAARRRRELELGSGLLSRCRERPD